MSVDLLLEVSYHITCVLCCCCAPVEFWPSVLLNFGLFSCLVSLKGLLIFQFQTCMKVLCMKVLFDLFCRCFVLIELLIMAFSLFVGVPFLEMSASLSFMLLLWCLGSVESREAKPFWAFAGPCPWVLQSMCFLE